MIAALPVSLIPTQAAEYYAIPGAAARRAFLDQHPDFPDADLRLKWLNARSFSLGKSGEADAFMRAWSTLLAAHANRSFFFRRQLQRELEQCMDWLGLSCYAALPPREQAVLREEWADFTRLLAQVSLGSKAYGSTLFGMVPMKEGAVERKFAEDILCTMQGYPRHWGREEAFAPLFEVMKAVCLHLLPDTADVFL